MDQSLFATQDTPSALLARLDHALPTRQSPFSARVDAVLLAIALAGALVGIVPAVALIARRLTLPIPLPAMLATGFVLAAYATAVVLLRRPLVGVVSALVILSTFSANVPLSAGIPGVPAAGIWLFEIPLYAGLAIAAYQRWDRDLSFTRTHYAFAVFVGWAFLAAVVGAGPRLDAGLLFALHFFMMFAVFAFIAAAVRREVLSLQTVVVLFIIAVLAQLAFVIAQLIHGVPFGLSRLGEVERVPDHFISIAGFRFRTGVYLSGLTGGAHQMAALSVLAAPIAALYAILGQREMRIRVAAGIVAVALFAFIRLTMKDAARGAGLVVLVAVVASVGVSLWRQSVPRRAVTRRLGACVPIGAAAIGALLYPSERFGTGVYIPDGSSVEGGASTGGETGGGSIESPSATPDLTAIKDLHIPFFNLQTLGVRAKQYLAAFDAFTHYPIFGLGGGNFPFIAVSDYGLHRAARWSRPVGFGIHNGYLAVLVGTGLPGFLLFCGTIVGILWAAVGLIRRQAVPVWIGYGLCAGFLGYAAFLFWDVTLATPTGSMPFFILAGAVVGTAHNARASEGVER